MIKIDFYEKIWSKTKFSNRYAYYFESTFLKDCDCGLGFCYKEYHNSPKFYKL